MSSQRKLGAAVEPAEITHPEIGDGARLRNGEAKRPTASVNLGEHVVTITEGN